MIPYADLERALARWKARLSNKEGATPEPTDEDVEMGTRPHGMDGLPPPRELTGEIDLSDDVVESVDIGRRPARTTRH
jgi:hypothetical protein